MMNERIKELAEQAWNYVMVCDGRYSKLSTQLFNEKFAELIVQKCVTVIQREVSMKYKDGGETEEFMGGHYAGSILARIKIKEHFGVE